ncbi:MAG: hypothetical protein R3E66_09960 [bacterium]
MLKSLLRVGAILTAVVSLGACDPPATVQVEDEKVDDKLPPARVDLPDPPPASGFTIPEKNSDGTMRVEGLIHHQEKFLDQKVDVKGLIVKLSTPCDPKKAKKTGDPCPEPNLFIKDDADAQKVLRVVGYDEDFVKKSKLAEGEEHVFKGTYSKVAQGFVATEDGLLLLDYVDDMAVVEPK